MWPAGRIAAHDVVSGAPIEHHKRLLGFSIDKISILRTWICGLISRRQARSSWSFINAAGDHRRSSLTGKGRLPRSRPAFRNLARPSPVFSARQSRTSPLVAERLRRELRNLRLFPPQLDLLPLAIDPRLQLGDLGRNTLRSREACSPPWLGSCRVDAEGRKVAEGSGRASLRMTIVGLTSPTSSSTIRSI